MMSKQTEILSRTSTLFILFILCVITLVTIQLLANFWNLTLLDEVYSTNEARELLLQMTDDQKVVHLWITASLDVIYPIVFGGLLAGLILKFLPKYGSYLILFAILGVIMDWSENLIQILALLNILDALRLKP